MAMESKPSWTPSLPRRLVPRLPTGLMMHNLLLYIVYLLIMIVISSPREDGGAVQAATRSTFMASMPTSVSCTTPTHGVGFVASSVTSSSRHSSSSQQRQQQDSFGTCHIHLKTLSIIRGGSSGGYDDDQYEGDEEEDDDGADFAADDQDDDDDQDVFDVLASTLQRHAQERQVDSYTNSDLDLSTVSIPKLSKTLQKLASSQSTFKGLDGMAHEAYQRTHSSGSRVEDGMDGDGDSFDEEYGDDSSLTSVAGRAQRSLARLRAVTDAFEGCELVEELDLGSLVQHDDDDEKHSSVSSKDESPAAEDPILVARKQQVVFNTTLLEDKKKTVLPLSVLVLYDPIYDGGAGIEYGSPSTDTHLDGKRKPRGRLLVVLSDPHSESMQETLSILISPKATQQIRLSSGLVTNEVASVQRRLYKTAGELLSAIEAPLRDYSSKNNTTGTTSSPAIHFVGHSLAGGVACLAATICDGSIPMPKMKKQTKEDESRKMRDKSVTTATTTNPELASTNEGKDKKNLDIDGAPNKEPSSLDKADTMPHDTAEEVTEVVSKAGSNPVIVKAPLCGIGRGRSSAVSLGGPPCLSSNVVAAFCTSILFGDDIVCRTTSASYQKLVGRVSRTLNGGFVGRNLGWMSDTISLTVSSLQSHAHGSEGEEVHLSVPGRAYLIRPRRIGGTSSIHEVGSLKNKGGRDALREALLWQLHDILLSKSMWKHHRLESYIHGLDRVQLRGSVAAAAAGG